MKHDPEPRPVLLAVLATLLLACGATAQQQASSPGTTFHKAPRALAKDARTSDWNFLGRQRRCRSPETRIAASWPASGPPLVWEMERGEGYACPAIADGRVVYTHRVGDRSHVDCLEAETGRRIWRHSAPCNYSARYIRDAGPRSSPVIHGGRVYVHGVEGVLRCFNLQTGEVTWQRDLAKEMRAPLDFFGAVSTPLVYGDMLIQNVGGPGACVVAFDLESGETRWRAGDKWGPSCASPVIGKVRGADRLFVLAGGESRPPVGGLLILDPRSGEVAMRHPFRSRTFESVIASSPVVGADWVFISSSYNVGSAVLGIDEEGTWTQRWKNRRIGLQFSNGVFHDGGIYAVDGRSDRAGAVININPKNGEEVWRSDLDWDETVMWNGAQRTVNFSIGEGSLLWVEGGFLCLGDNGHLLRLTVTPKGVEIMSRAWLFKANQSWTPLALSRGLLYVCQNRPERFGDLPARLLCFDLRAENP